MGAPTRLESGRGITSVGSNPTPSAPITLDLGFTSVVIIKMNNGYNVIDVKHTLNLIEVERSGSEFAIWDVRSGDKILIYRWRDCAGADLSGNVLRAIESLVCDCYQGWGPVCPKCADKVGGELAVLYHEMQREKQWAS